ncbi:TetR family transcriptional regulator [Sphingobium cloacae]|uniref:TetR family transcriptional regulator n=1 Tax=Sphingobium cloacae TaxID=120107 RepID=A0A1E1F491_9SPHN|nr:TetR family transcriptional regulator [Sphingobium cloacae]BAV65343.1 TetR family transcriptional regulator [Sphingobium cloacae]
MQSNEWRQTSDLLRSILAGATKPPMVRVRMLVYAFLLSECEEAPIRGALHDAAPLYRDGPEAIEFRAASADSVEDFMREVLPDATEETRLRTGDLIKTTLSEVGGSFSSTPRTEAEIAGYADALADMFCAYLERLAKRETRLCSDLALPEAAAASAAFAAVRGSSWSLQNLSYVHRSMGEPE